MTKRDRWEYEEVIVRKDIKSLRWLAEDNNDYEIGDTMEEALEGLYRSRRNYIEEEYGD